jgi:hypothetical protein
MREARVGGIACSLVGPWRVYRPLHTITTRLGLRDLSSFAIAREVRLSGVHMAVVGDLR